MERNREPQIRVPRLFSAHSVAHAPHDCRVDIIIANCTYSINGLALLGQALRRVTIMNALTFVEIGEVLYDVFEDGTETLGGTPLN